MKFSVKVNATSANIGAGCMIALTPEKRAGIFAARFSGVKALAVAVLFRKAEFLSGEQFRQSGYLFHA